jgi:hypothetical protein
VQDLDSRKRFHGKAVLTNWHLVIDPSENPGLQPSVGPDKLSLGKVSDLIFVVQYQYQAR